MKTSQSYIEVSGEKLFVQRWGRGVPILCLPATGHDSRDFEPLGRAVGGEFEIVALDFPGQGRSPRGTGPVTADHYADVAAAAIDALGLERPVILGNSIGGAAAVVLASRRPDLRGLVLCDPGGLAPVGHREAGFIRALVRFFGAGARRAWWYPAAFGLYYGRILPRAPQRRREIVAQAFEIAPILVQSWTSFAEPEADIRSLPPRIAMPVLLAWSKGDRIIAWARSKAAALTFPRHELRLYRGGHSAFLEDRDAFAADLRAAVRAWR